MTLAIDLGWMAWTWETAAFFLTIAGLLVATTASSACAPPAATGCSSRFWAAPTSI